MKELTREEIKEVEKYMNTLKDVDKYKYYFTSIELGEPLRAWLDGGYYIDLAIEDNKYWVGVAKIYDKPCGFSFIALLKKLAEEYKEIWQWCYVKNTKAMKFHNLLERKMNCKRIIENGISIVVMKGANNGKRW